MVAESAGGSPAGAFKWKIALAGIPIGQRQTAQRDAIAKVIRRARGPLTIGEIHARARRGLRSLGIATVYRNVNLLVKAGEIRTVVLPDGERRYESARLSHHHHFHCEVCRKVFDLAGCPVAISDGTTLPGGFLVRDHELTLHGLCPQCARRKRKRGRTKPSPSR